jgi:hypothetical protein
MFKLTILYKKYFAILIPLLFLTNCASITTGTNQSLSVETGSTEGAKCTLTNNKGTWYVERTPGTVIVHRSFGDLQITCSKDGKTKTLKVESKTKGMMYGNIILGAGVVIGAAVDAGNGSGYDYPSLINVSL